MDYATKPTNREELRAIARWFCHLFGVRNKFKFPVMEVFERFHSKFPNCITTVVDDGDLPEGIPARGQLMMDGTYVIQVADSVYRGAANGVGGYRAHILHEMCHYVLMFVFGFTPIFQRDVYAENVPCYERVEWQAKALCGEIMIPYDETRGMTVRQIMKKCQVSEDAAEKKIKIENNEAKRLLALSGGGT